jgi:phosphate transport system substrate-binding protein
MGARIMTHRPILLVLAMFVVAACSRSEPDAVTTKPASGKPVVVDGSSTVWLVSKAVAEEFPRTDGTATVEESGTTGGFRKFCHGEIDVAGASRPIERDEIEACSRAGIEFLELPIGYDGIAVVVNARNTWVDHLTVAELRAMWRPEASGVVARWRDVRASFPDRPLHLFGPGSDSGTFDYFTLAIVGAQRASRRDYTASEDDAVLVKGVIGDEEALGYFGFAYYSANKGKLRIVPIDDEDPRNGDGPIEPSLPTVANGRYQPLSRPILIYVSTTALRRPEVERFVALYMKTARAVSSEVGYFPLTLRADQLVQARYEARTRGSMFEGGPAIGVALEGLLEGKPSRPRGR